VMRGGKNLGGLGVYIFRWTVWVAAGCFKVLFLSLVWAVSMMKHGFWTMQWSRHDVMLLYNKSRCI